MIGLKLLFERLSQIQLTTKWRRDGRRAARTPFNGGGETLYGVSARPLCSCCCNWFAIATIGRTDKYQDGLPRANATGLRPAFFEQLHIPLVGEKSGQGGMDDVPLPATPFDLDASLEPEAPLDPVAPTDLAQLMHSAI